MAKISNDEKLELLRLAGSISMMEDMELVARHRHDPVSVDGKVNMDRILNFLNQFNEFINHEPRPFEPMIEKEMKL